MLLYRSLEYQLQLTLHRKEKEEEEEKDEEEEKEKERKNLTAASQYSEVYVRTYAVSVKQYFTLVFTHKITLHLSLVLKLNAKDNYLSKSTLTLKKANKTRIVRL